MWRSRWITGDRKVNSCRPPNRVASGMIKRGKEAMRADDEVVAKSDVFALQKPICELQRVLGKKTLENELLHEAVRSPTKNNDLAAPVVCPRALRREVCCSGPVTTGRISVQLKLREIMAPRHGGAMKTSRFTEDGKDASHPKKLLAERDLAIDVIKLAPRRFISCALCSTSPVVADARAVGAVSALRLSSHPGLPGSTGHGMSADRAHRRCRQSGLQVPKQRRRKRVATHRPLPLPTPGKNDVWACDFVYD